jgi:hypothetical protein
MSDDDRHPAVRAKGTMTRVRAAEQRDVDHEPDIEAERGFARHNDVIITEAFDESDGTSRVRHAGEDPKLHQILLTERAQLHRHRVSEEQRSRRLLAWLASALLLGSAAILAFAPQSTNVYLGAAFLIVAAGAFGIKAFRIKLKDFELVAGERSARVSEREP